MILICVFYFFGIFAELQQIEKLLNSTEENENGPQIYYVNILTVSMRLR